MLKPARLVPRRPPTRAHVSLVYHVKQFAVKMCYKVLLVTLAAASVESLPQFFQPQFGLQRQFMPVYTDQSVFVDRRSLPQHSVNSHNYYQDFGLNDGQYPQYESLKRQPSESFENRHTGGSLPEYQENYGSDTFKVQGREQEHLTDNFQNDFSNSGVNTQRNQLTAAQPLHTQHNTNVRNLNTQNNDYDYGRNEKPITLNPVKVETRVSPSVDATTNSYQNSNNYSPNEDLSPNKQKPNENRFPKDNPVQNIEMSRTNKTQRRDNNTNKNINPRPTTPNVRQEDSRQGDNRKAFDTNTYVNNENYHNSNTNIIRPNSTDTDNIYSNADNTKNNTKQDNKVTISTNIQQHGSNTNKQNARPYISENVDDATNDGKRDSKNEVQKPNFESKSKQSGNLPEGPEEGDKWIWGYSEVTETEAPMSTVDLDDRASFDAAMCPAGKIKVDGMCIKVDM